MKKIIFSIILIIIIVLAIIIVGVNSNKRKKGDILEFNSQFEALKTKTMYGADVLTIINKAIDNNKTYNIQKSDDGYYIENEENSVKIELILLSKNEKDEIEEKTYQMETLEKAGLTDFISSFGLISFECSDIKYNKQKRVSKVVIKQLEL